MVSMEVVPPGLFRIITTCSATRNSETSIQSCERAVNIAQVNDEQQAATAANPMITATYLYLVGFTLFSNGGRKEAPSLPKLWNLSSVFADSMFCREWTVTFVWWSQKLVSGNIALSQVTIGDLKYKLDPQVLTQSR